MENINHLRKLSNEALVSNLKELAQRERTLLTQLLHYLKELENRQLYLEMGYSSLFAYMTEELGYSEGGAIRRIKAMRLIKDIPEVEEKIQTGKISLTVASSIQGFLQKETKKRRSQLPSAPKVRNRTEYSKIIKKEEKLALIQKLEGTSSRACEKKLAEISPETRLPKEKIRIISPENAVIEFVAHKELQEKLNRLKELTSHQNPEGKYSLLIEKMVDHYLEKIDPVRREQRRAKKGKKVSRVNKKAPSAGPVRNKQANSAQWAEANCALGEPTLGENKNWGEQAQNFRLPPPQTTKQQKSPPAPAVSRYVSPKLRDYIWVRDNGACQYQDRKTGKVCSSNHLLEIDHCYPFSLGGGNSEDNLQLRCRAHNQYQAEMIFS